MDSVYTRTVRPSRKYDYLYDPTFHVSSDRDHSKQSYKAQSGFDRLRYEPYFKTMFSTLRHYPHQRVTLDMTDAVPKHVARHWLGYKDQAREAIVRYKKFHYDPRVTVPEQHFPPSNARSTDRYKYFFRPIIPFMAQVPPNVVLDRKDREDPLLAPLREDNLDRVLAGPKTRSIQVQTDYRDSEAQTDPYSPQIKYFLGPLPEVMTITALCWGRGLPAGLAEVEMIERAREKRKWEASLPPIQDKDQLELRRKMMAEQETKEWAFRESEIDKLQQERLKVLCEMMENRNKDHEELDSKRLEHLWDKRQAEKNRKVAHLYSEHLKAVRKLAQESKNVEKKYPRRDIIKDYSSYDSQVYAPMNRIGVYLDSGAEKYVTNSKYTTTLDGILELEATLPPYATSPSIEVPIRNAKGVGLRARRRQKLGQVLEQVHTDLIDARNKKKVTKPLRLLERVEVPVPRPPTPTADHPDLEEEKKELAIILLQQIIRGRAIQTKMFEGKERRKELIQELRHTHALQSPEQKIKKEEEKQILALQAAQKRQQHKEKTIQDGVENTPALHIGEKLDFLNKELVRLQEERRIAAFVMLAERQRRMREAEEGGRRQREERLRRMEDEVFKQMMRVHQGSVDTYLEDVIMASINSTADQQAREDIAKKAEVINEVAAQFLHTELSGKELVSEMVHTFLLPEVEKETLRHRVRLDQRKHLLAAHRIVQENLEQNKKDI